MKRQRMWRVVLALLIFGNFASIGASQREKPTPPTAQPGGLTKLTGEVIDIHGPRVFTIRERPGTEREWVVLTPRPLTPGFKGATVTVEGTVRRLTETDLQRGAAYRDLDDQSRARLTGRSVMVAISVLAIVKGQATTTPETPAAPEPRAETPLRVRQPPPDRPMALRPSMLVANLDIFVGQQVRVLNARVVGVLEPTAFLIEPATSYLKPLGWRERVLVLIGSSTLRAPADLIVGSTVNLTGVPRTIVGMKMTREVGWPAWLDPERIERLEVQAAFVASSVQTSDGVELTNASPATAPQAAIR